MGNMKSPLPQCAAMVRIQNILSGKWKITILWYIAEYEVQRFRELRRRLGDITQSTLTKQLRELEQDGFISRYIYQEVPPKVEYSLTDLGKKFYPYIERHEKLERYTSDVNEKGLPNSPFLSYSMPLNVPAIPPTRLHWHYI